MCFQWNDVTYIIQWYVNSCLCDFCVVQMVIHIQHCQPRYLAALEAFLFYCLLCVPWGMQQKFKHWPCSYLSDRNFHICFLIISLVWTWKLDLNSNGCCDTTDGFQPTAKIEMYFSKNLQIVTARYIIYIYSIIK